MDRALQFLLAGLALGAFAGLAGASGIAVPALYEDSEPAELRVDSLDRLETGCKDDLTGYARSSHGNYSATKLSVIDADRPDAALSAWTERVSPADADLTTFAVHVETVSDGPANETCPHGIRYDLELSYDDGYQKGWLAGDYGLRFLYYENGELAGCSGRTTGGLDHDCHRFYQPPDRTWANATATGV